LVALLTIGAAMNAASSSGWERYLMAPLAAALALLCLVIARRQETDPEAENLGLSSP
jgi:hypothetical protein